jgi:hypothetical protein
MLAACVEHAAELRWAPSLKLAPLSWLGLLAVVGGELLRKAAMVSALSGVCALPVMWWLFVVAKITGAMMHGAAAISQILPAPPATRCPPPVQVTAAHNFTHLIQTRRRPQHSLVTQGVYAWVRHPGYTGWAVWAVGTQLLLCNPVCAAGFATAAWRFFAGRIQYEDALLASFFGAAFEQYRAAVPSGIPGVP